MEKLVVIDGNFWLFSCYYATAAMGNLMVNKDGVPTNAVYGFANRLESLLKQNPEYIVVAFDAKGKTFRSELLEEYKGTRKPTPDELVCQFSMVREYLEAHHIPYIEKEGYEGDDIIGTISKKASNQGMEVAVYTNDKDMMQLIDSNVKQYKKPQKTNDYEVITVESFKEKYNLEYVNLYGFNNTYGLAVNKDIAEKYNLKTYSDLAKVSNNLIFGAEYDFFEREDGYKELQKVYNMNFKKQIDMDIGLKYQAMKDKKIDVMVIFTTDGQLAISDVVVLKDDKKMYPSYRAGTVIRSEILSEYPELKPVLEKLNNILDDKTMADLNYQVESKGKKPEDVAREYLQEKGLLEAR